MNVEEEGKGEQKIIDVDFEIWRRKVHFLAKIHQKYLDDLRGSKLSKKEGKEIKKMLDLRWDFLTETDPTVNPSLKKAYHRLF